MLTRIREWSVCISSDITLGELQHVAIDLLSFSRETEGLEECSKGVYEGHIAEIKHVYESMHDHNVLLVTVSHAMSIVIHLAGMANEPFTEVLADSRLIQTVSLKEEARDVLRFLALDEASLDEELDALYAVVSHWQTHKCM